MIADREARIYAIKQKKISQDKVYQMLLHFNEVYDIMTDAEKKELMSLFIDKIEIYTEKQPDGRRVKQIDFQFPVMIGDNEGDSIIFPSLPDKCRNGMFIVQNS